MIEWIVGGILVGGIGYLGYKKIRNVDLGKLDLDDAVELFDMVSEFIAGGDDGSIDETDAILLVKRLEELIEKNKKEL